MNQCDCVNHSLCGGLLYKLIGQKIIRCHRHIVLHDLWCATPPTCDFYDWLDELDDETAQMMYELHKEAVPLYYWKEI